MYDKTKRIAVIRHTTVDIAGRKHRLLRAVTWAERSEDRILLGYFPEGLLDLAAAVVWGLWTKQHPSNSDRR